MVMSLDNVLAMAAAAKGHMWMLIVGLVITVPVILFGSALLMKLMERFPIFVMIGAALIGWVAGEMIISDPAIKDWVDANMASLHTIAPVGVRGARDRRRQDPRAHGARARAGGDIALP